MDIVVRSPHCSVSDRFRDYVTEKITKLEKLNARAIRVEVELGIQRHRGQADQSRVEITLHTKGPLVRAEASAEDKLAAFDLALDKLMTQLRRAADRRKVHRGSRRRPASLAEATRTLPPPPAEAEPVPDVPPTAGVEVDGEGPFVVREKTHVAAPMGLDQALYEMELVGHDFFLFVDAESGLPSVVYRRRGYDYGVIHLQTTATGNDSPRAHANGHRAASVPAAAD